MVESVAATVQDVNTSVDQAERDLTSSALQPLQAVLETLKMVINYCWSQELCSIATMEGVILNGICLYLCLPSRDRRDLGNLLEIKKC